jgi:aminoglycoside phosphotransferase family enzyme/predicted kinase
MLESAASEPFAGVSETHSSVVFFVGDRVYKLKKPVRLGFLDFRTQAAREGACRRETELNRRFAPDVYLGVAEVRGPSGGSCEHLVVMRRMPANRRLSSLIRAGKEVAGPVRQVARVLAAQHAAAARGPQIAEQGSRDSLRGRWRASFAQLRQMAGQLPDPAGLTEAAEADQVERLAERFLAGRAPLFSARIRDGRVVDGHGDLLADDIFCLDDGPRILDCLEFDDRLRWLDGLDDAAFLAMDLERLGAPALAERFTGWYAEFAADPAPPSLQHHYLAYRAFVRAKVAAIRSAQGDPDAAAEVRQLAAMTLRHLRAGAVTLVLIGGLPGTGKSVLAGVLAGRLGCTVLSSDRVRKELAGLPPQAPAAAPYGTGIYAASWTGRTYRELLRRAQALLELGESVIIDASWLAAEHRAAAAAVAENAAADLVQLRCIALPTVAAQRMNTRKGDASDADPAIAAQLATTQDPWPDAITIDTGGTGISGSPSESAEPVQRALEAIRPHGPQHVWRPARPYMLPG